MILGGTIMKSEEIGKLIKEKRIAKNMTQEELAKKLYVSNKTISKWETGKGIPSIDLLMPISETLDIELKTLLTGNNKSYEELLVEEVQKNKKRYLINIIGGILLCLGLCILEVLLYMANVSEKLSLIVFGVVIFMMLILETSLYIKYKK